LLTQALSKSLRPALSCVCYLCPYSVQTLCSATLINRAVLVVPRHVVDNRSMCSVSPWNFTPQPFGLSQSPSSVVATVALSEAVNDNLVVVEAPIVETPVVERLFLDNKKNVVKRPERLYLFLFFLIFFLSFFLFLHTKTQAKDIRHIHTAYTRITS